nr:MAG TPA: hypothetical protein [Caudoviricetes sp.]
MPYQGWSDSTEDLRRGSNPPRCKIELFGVLQTRW